MQHIDHFSTCFQSRWQHLLYKVQYKYSLLGQMAAHSISKIYGCCVWVEDWIILPVLSGSAVMWNSKFTKIFRITKINIPNWKISADLPLFQLLLHIMWWIDTTIKLYSAHMFIYMSFVNWTVGPKLVTSSYDGRTSLVPQDSGGEVK